MPALKCKRRNFLLAGVAVATSESLLAQSPPDTAMEPRRKGPLVWLGLDQAELDAAYDQLQYAPNARQVLRRYALNSESARMRLGAPRHLAYGPSEIERLDLYMAPAAGGDAPINVFLHGGAWRNGRARDYAFPAELFVRSGAHLVVPDFVWVQDADGRLAVMAEQVRRAIAWVHRNARSFGGDPNRIYVSGHSSGAHLAATALMTDWPNEFGLPADVVKGAVCCSGIYDLKPVRLSSRNNYVRLTDESEEALSPQRHLDKLRAPVIVAYGSHETPEFQRQARDFAATIAGAGKEVRLLAGDEYNHFEIIETLANPYGLLGRAALEQMHLRG